MGGWTAKHYLCDPAEIGTRPDETVDGTGIWSGDMLVCDVFPVRNAAEWDADDDRSGKTDYMRRTAMAMIRAAPEALELVRLVAERHTAPDTREYELQMMAKAILADMRKPEEK